MILQSKKLFLLPIFSGILLALTLPPFELTFFVWVALVPIFFFFNNQNIGVRESFVGGIFMGLIYFVTLVYPLGTINGWWWSNTGGFFWNNREVLLIIFVLLLSLYGSIFYGLFGVLFKKILKNPRFLLISMPFVWAILEYLRGKAVLGYSWGHLGYALHNQEYLLQGAKVFGIFGLSIVVLFANIIIFFLLKSIIEGGVYTKKVFHYVSLLFVIYSSLWFFGYMEIKNDTQKNTSPILVNILHINERTEDALTRDTYESYLVKLEEMFVNNPDIILLPENIFPLLTLDEDTKKSFGYNDSGLYIFNRLINMSKTNPDTSIVAGIHTRKESLSFNSVVVFENGEIGSIYRKQNLLPIAEYATGIFASQHVNPLATKPSSDDFVVSGRIASPLICSEVAFPGAVHKEASFIISPSNDSVFNSPNAARENHIMAIMRAVENNMYVLRSTKGGMSSIISPTGRIIQLRTGGNKIEILQAFIYP